MIPHYHPPYGILRVAIEWVLSLRAPTNEALEEQFRSALPVKDAVVIPSVRAGILALLRLRLPPHGHVIAPAYTCLVVHEAIAASGAPSRYIEPTSDDYLMSLADLISAGAPGCAFVLSEMYGMPYGDECLASLAKLNPSITIIDSAMGIPSPERLLKLRGHEVAMFSFGMGKSMCAGGGGVALFADPAIAAEFRTERDRVTKGLSIQDAFRSNLRLVAGMLLRTRLLCGRAGALRDALKTPRRPAMASAKKPPVRLSVIDTNPAWTMPMTALQRRLATRNLSRLHDSRTLRRAQARQYAKTLNGDLSNKELEARYSAQSHYPMRVGASTREALRMRLREAGFGIGDEFPISGLLRPSDHPITRQLATEIVTLPLGEGVSASDITNLCRAISDSLSNLPP